MSDKLEIQMIECVQFVTRLNGVTQMMRKFPVIQITILKNEIKAERNLILIFSSWLNYL